MRALFTWSSHQSKSFDTLAGLSSLIEDRILSTNKNALAWSSAPESSRRTFRTKPIIVLETIVAYTRTIRSTFRVWTTWCSFNTFALWFVKAWLTNAYSHTIVICILTAMNRVNNNWWVNNRRASSRWFCSRWVSSRRSSSRWSSSRWGRSWCSSCIMFACLGSSRVGDKNGNWNSNIRKSTGSINKNVTNLTNAFVSIVIRVFRTVGRISNLWRSRSGCLGRLSSLRRSRSFWWLRSSDDFRWLRSSSFSGVSDYCCGGCGGGGGSSLDAFSSNKDES